MIPIIVIFFNNSDSITTDNSSLVYLFGLFVAMFLYIILHELTHGLFYKIFTHEKLTFGLTFTVAYCGVPKLYVKRIAALITTLAPFVIFSFVFVVPMFFIKEQLLFLSLGLMFAIHVSGCIGDIIVGFILIFRFRGKELVVNDTGPKQTFYIKQ